jgi:hypothetical protein
MDDLTDQVTNYLKEHCETIRNVQIKQATADDKKIADLDKD